MTRFITYLLNKFLYLFQIYSNNIDSIYNSKVFESESSGK